MGKGPYGAILPVYDLTFEDGQGPFVIRAHLDKLSEFRARGMVGLDAEQQNLEILCYDPKEGSPRLRHNMKASIAPSFMGLEGTLQLKAQPRSELIPQEQAEGVTLYGEFVESAASVDDGGEWSEWTRRRFIPDGGETLTGGPSGDWQPEVIRLSLIATPSDELDDFAPLTARVIARAGTLQPGDLIIHPVHGTRQVRGVEVEGDFETARVEG